MTMLDRKLFRDFWKLRAQGLAIMLLIGSGVALFVMSTSNYLMLVEMQALHYETERFGDVFAQVRRAPLPLANRIAALDGVAAVEPRIAQNVRVNRDDSRFPVAGRVVSIPAHDQPQLNRLRLMSGRWIDPARPNEVIVNTSYAEARSVQLGERIEVFLNGRRQVFTIVGTAMSPEFVFASRSGVPLPDNRNYVIIWAGTDAVAAAFDMKGAFNDLVIRLSPGASETRLIPEIDRLIEPYGGLGAYGRDIHPSHRFVEDEIAEQRVTSIIAPLIFLGIASFLLNVALTRLIGTQREQIATLKALGYPNMPIFWHYLKLAMLITACGVLIGAVFGGWLGRSMTDLYRPFFRFPDWNYTFRPWLPLVAGSLAFAAAIAGVFNAVRHVVMQPAAIAMKPEIPISQGGTLLRRLVSRIVTAPRQLMAFRALAGRPLRSALTIFGLSLSVPIVALGVFWWDALGAMVDINFGRINRSHADVVLNHAVSSRAVREIAALPGVRFVEGQRVVPVRFRAGHRSYRGSVQGLEPGSELLVPRDADLAPLALPADGVVLSRRLAARLGVSVGDSLRAEILEGARPSREVSVTALADDILGLTAYMDIGALNRLLREGASVNALLLSVDSSFADDVWKRLRDFPAIEAFTPRETIFAAFNDTIAGMILVSSAFLAGFGVLIAAGLIYNAARIALQEHAWELAGLRILGLTRAEVSRILFAELAILAAVALPLGMLLSRWLIVFLLGLRQNDSFQMPAVVTPFTLGASVLIVLVAIVLSAASIRRQIDAIELTSVLKTRD